MWSIIFNVALSLLSVIELQCNEALFGLILSLLEVGVLDRKGNSGYMSWHSLHNNAYLMRFQRWVVFYLLLHLLKIVFLLMIRLL
jgi:hypothetical protein